MFVSKENEIGLVNRMQKRRLDGAGGGGCVGGRRVWMGSAETDANLPY